MPSGDAWPDPAPASPVRGGVRQEAPGRIGAMGADPLEAWGLFLRAHRVLVAQMADTLERGLGLPLTWYDVLKHLGDASGRLRMGELEGRVLLSQSGVSRLVARMEEAGLVRRQVVPQDRRAAEVALTAQGREALREALPRQRAQVRRLFADRITPEEAEVLVRVCRRLAEPPPE